MAEYLAKGLDEPEKVEMPDKLEFIISADCSGQEPDLELAERLAERYGLARMPWSTPSYQFYVRPEWVDTEDTGVFGVRLQRGW